MVAHGSRGLLIRGASGSGKSALALELMAYGAALVADDQVLLRPESGQVIARAPEPLVGRIEARGIGIIRTDRVESVALDLIADFDLQSPSRLPSDGADTLCGIVLRVVAIGGLTCPGPALWSILRGALEAHK